MFPSVPFSQGWWGAQKQAGIPRRSWICRARASSLETAGLPLPIILAISRTPLCYLASSITSSRSSMPRWLQWPTASSCDACVFASTIAGLPWVISRVQEALHSERRSALLFLGKDGPCPSSVASGLAKSRCAISSHAPFQSRTMPSPQAAQQDSQERAAATLLTGVLPRISVRASLKMPPKSVAVIASVKNAATSSLPSSKDCLSSAR